MKAILLSLLVSTCLLSQDLQSDSVNIAELVKHQISTVRESGGTFSKRAGTVTNNTQDSGKNESAVIPENIFLIIFFSVEVALGIAIYLVNKRRRVQAKVQPLKAVPLTNKTENKKLVKNERQQLAAYVKCQLALYKTKEEIAAEAKKLNVPVGELELAARLQKMTKGA